MASIVASVRSAVKERIDSNKDSFTVNDFTLEETYLPAAKVEALNTPKVFVIAMSSDDDVITRASSYEKEIPVQVGVLKILTDHTSVTEVDDLVELEEDIRHCVTKTEYTKDPVSGKLGKISWTRNEAMKDENGLPVAYGFLREGSVFLAYFIAYFKAVIQS